MFDCNNIFDVILQKTTLLFVKNHLFSQLYDICFYLIQIICIKSNGFKYFYPRVIWFYIFLSNTNNFQTDLFGQ